MLHDKKKTWEIDYKDQPVRISQVGEEPERYQVECLSGDCSFVVVRTADSQFEIERSDTDNETNENYIAMWEVLAKKCATEISGAISGPFLLKPQSLSY